jgi:hypothetical protein
MFQLLLVVRDDKQQFRENKLVGQLLKMETESFFRFFIIYKMFYTERKLNRLSNVIFIFDCHCPKHQTKATSSHSTTKYKYGPSYKIFTLKTYLNFQAWLF